MYRMKGTIFTVDLSWDENCSNLIKKVNARMHLLRKVWSFGSTQQEMVHLWKVFCRSILEQSCVVWDSGLSQENIADIERTQKTFAKLVLEEDYKGYYSSLKKLRLEPLHQRRKMLQLKFIKNTLSNGFFSDLFPKNSKKTQNENYSSRKIQGDTCKHKIPKFPSNCDAKNTK